MLRCLCSASSISPVVYSTKTTTTTGKMEGPEQKLFRMTPYLTTKRRTTHNTEIPDPAGRHRGNDGMDKDLCAVCAAAIGAFIKNKIYNKNPPFV